MVNLITQPVGGIYSLRHKLSLLAAVAMVGMGAAAQTTPAPLSESVQRQALGPYRVILRSAAAVVVPTKPKAARGAAAATVPAPPAVRAEQSALRRAAETGPLPAPLMTPAVVQVPEVTESLALVAPVAALAALTTPAPVAVASKTALILIKSDPPVLSRSLAAESPAGVVRVAFNVNPDGATSDLKIAASSNRRLNSAVLAAVTDWRYQPIDVLQAAELEVVFTND